MNAIQPKRLARIAAGSIFLVGFLVWLGWGFDITILKGVWPGWPNQSPISAPTFLLAAISLWCLTMVRPVSVTDHKPDIWRWVSQFCAVLVGLIGFCRLADYLLVTNLPFEMLWFHEVVPPGKSPTHMAHATAVEFMLISGALFYAARPGANKRFQFFALACGLVGCLGLIRYVYGGEPLLYFSQMSVISAACFPVLSIGVLCARPDVGLAALALSDSVGGMMMRRLLPAAVVMPFVIGWLRLEGQNAGWFGTEAGLGLFALSNVVLFTGLIWAAATVLHALDLNRKQTELATAQLAAIVLFSDDAIIGKNLNSIITSWNKGAEKIFGYTAEEMVGNSIMRLIPAERQAEENYILGEIRQGRSIKHFETLRQTKDGRQIHVSVTASPINDSNGKVVGVSKVARDISERKRDEASLRRTDRALRMVSECNQVLVRASSETELLQAICRIVVDHGGYRMAWVGFAEQDEAKLVRPVAQAGFETGYLDNANISWAETERGRGPTGKAIRTGQVVIARDIPHAPAYEPWRAVAIQRGYASSATLPLISGERVFGALMVYAVESDAFNDEEVALLTELADDLAYGVTVLRTRIEHRQAEDRLRESEERFRTLVEMAPEAIFIQTNGRFAYVNAAALQLFGATQPAELLGQPVISRVHPDQQASVLERIKTINEQRRRAGSADSVFIALDGSERNVMTSGVPFQYENQNGALVFVMDITKRKQAEAVLKQSEARRKLALDAAKAGTWEWDLGTNQNIWSDELWKLYGLEPNSCEPTYEVWRQTVHPEGREQVEQTLKDVVAQAAELNLEWRVNDSGGSTRWLMSRGRPMRDAAGRVNRYQGVVMDITHRKQLELAVLESEERFRTMANSMSQLAWIAKADGYIYWYNRRWYEYTGTTPAAMEGWGWQSVHDPAVLPKVMAKWQAAVATGEPFDMEFPLRRADGQFRTFLTRGEPYKDATGKVVQWFGTNTDVDELKQAEEKIRQLNAGLEQRVIERTAQLEATNKELEAFSYSVSHDLRAPLRAVNGFAEIVMREYGPQLSAQAKHYLDRIRNGGLQMGQLIDDLLAFSRLSRQGLKRQVVDMTQLAQATLDDFASQREGRLFEIKLETLPACQCDRALLKQVWANLISNAIKFTRDRSPAVIKIGCNSKDGENVYYITDNGAGFDMKYADKLFGVFQRLHSSDEFEGTGVGLAIVQRVVHRHDGRVWAEAEEGRGATFRFTIGEEKNYE